MGTSAGIFRAGGMTLLLGLALTGCGGPPEDGGRYGSVVELRDAVVKAGMECPDWDEHNSVTTAASSGTCSDSLVMATYASTADKQEQIDRYKLLGEAIELTCLIGENWTINVTKDGDVETLHNKLGGTILKTPGKA